MTFDNTLSTCCVVNLKVSIIRGDGGYVMNKEIFEYTPPAVFLVPEIQLNFRILIGPKNIRLDANCLLIVPWMT